MLADPQVGLVIVTSIPSSHFELVKAALLAGKHVVCEKPFVPSSEEASELARLAKQQGVVLSVYQNRRWDADFVTVKGLLQDAALGRISEFESHFDRHRPEPPAAGTTWKAQDLPASGAIFDLGSHLLDQFVALFGLPERVKAFVGNQRLYKDAGTGGEAGGDSFTVLLHYDKLNMLGTAKAAVVSAEPEQLRFWVRGTRGTFKKFNLDVQEPQLKDGKRPGQEGFGVEPAEANGTLTVVDSDTNQPSARRVAPKSPPETYLRFYELLAKAIRGEGDNPVSAEDNTLVIKLIEAAKLSSAEERTIRLN